MPDSPQTWHYGLVAKWWSEFNDDGPEIAYFRKFIEGDGQPALDLGVWNRAFAPAVPPRRARRGRLRHLDRSLSAERRHRARDCRQPFLSRRCTSSTRPARTGPFSSAEPSGWEALATRTSKLSTASTSWNQMGRWCSTTRSRIPIRDNGSTGSRANAAPCQDRGHRRLPKCESVRLTEARSSSGREFESSIRPVFPKRTAAHAGTSRVCRSRRARRPHRAGSNRGP